MPKHEPFTPKAIGKRIKSRGLQKLKWYCQMCQKQCRDENGFKCHTSSESHQRQLLLFSDNPNKYMDSFSSEFLKDFLHLLKTRFGTRRVHANQVYQEYIKDRNHLHMNATRWVTLTGFVKWMGRKGICNVDLTEKGWFITYIDRDPETLKRQENLKKKERLDKDYEERMAQILEEQIERGKMQSKHQPDSGDNAPTEFKKESEEEKIAFKLNVRKKESIENMPATSSALKDIDSKAQDLMERSSVISKCSVKRKKEEEAKKKSALEEIMEEQEKLKWKKIRRENWIVPDIVVKIVTPKLGEKYYKKKGVVKEVENKFIAVVEMLDTKDIIKLDQEYLETVIPSLGSSVKIVNGAYSDNIATLLDVDFDKFCCKIKVESGPFRDRIIDGVSYEDICKLHIVE
ncbi:hypothetical protein B4U79_01470 [Dinothrombium tinctorium]|uniref:DNA/RNA-binding protein Kin17 WH-like domain-containing protein n=1 Tax=Dinothrombium tinctorium TaxID=1965070 RepID=A0A3S3RKZ2_9ACAR|nr:hypothetical protein B4U79_01470 [Dinothrombium tinctorium]